MEILQWCLDNLNYWTVLLLMAIESSFIPFPSEIVVPPAAYKAAAGELNVVGVVASASCGAILGALINYILARTLGRTFVYWFVETKFGHLCMLSKEKMEHAEEYFREHGVSSTLIGRMVPAVRQLISIPAGLARMNFGAFLWWTFLGAFIWNCVLALLGYVAAGQMSLIKEYSHELSVAILVLLGAVVLYYGVKWLIGKLKAES